MIQNVGAHRLNRRTQWIVRAPDDYNQQLSERRAERVRNWFLEHRIVEKRAVSTVGYGEKKPVAPNEKPDGKDNPPGRALNRRVEIVVNTCAGIDEPPVTTAPLSATPPAGEAPVTKEAGWTHLRLMPLRQIRRMCRMQMRRCRMQLFRCPMQMPRSRTSPLKANSSNLI